MESDRTNQEQGCAEHTHSAIHTALDRGAPKVSSGRYTDYGFSLPSTNKDIQVRYVDWRDDPSSRPYWILTDNTTPKYDPLRGLRPRDKRREALSGPSVGVSTTAAVVNDSAAGAISTSSSTDAGIPSSLVDDVRNGRLRPSYLLDRALTFDIEGQVLTPDIIDIADQDVAAGGNDDDDDWETVASDVDDEEDPEPLRNHAAMRARPSDVPARGLQPSQEESSSDSDDSQVTIAAPIPGTARANRLARATARQAKLTKRAPDVSVNVSAEAQKIAQAALSDPTYDVDEAVFKIRANRERGLRTRKNNPIYAPLVDKDGNEIDEANQEVDDQGLYEGPDHRIGAQLSSSAGHWAHVKAMGRATRSKSDKGPQSAITPDSTVSVSTQKFYLVEIRRDC
jgi:hypothetical protein